MSITTRIILCVLTFALASAMTGCHVARKPVALIEPTYSHLDTPAARLAGEQPRYQIAAVKP